MIPAVLSTVHFEDGTEASGLDFARENAPTEAFYYVEFMAAGGIFCDVEGDGDPDVYLLNGRDLLQPIGDDTPRNALYHNDSAGHFTRATGTGLEDPRYSVGVAGGDIDNDGDVDLYVTNFDEANALFVNDGTGHFEDRAVAAGVPGVACFDSSCAFLDVDADGWLDLYVANCVPTHMTDNPECEMAARDGSGMVRRYCVPDDFEPMPDLLYRNLGDGRFEDASVSSGVAGAVGRSLGVACGDYDNDGDQDIFVACDRTPNLYFENDGGGRFTERGWDAGVSHGPNGKARGGMGIASGDWDGDGLLDVAVTYFEREQNGFYTNRPGARFVDRAGANGAGKPSFELLGWGIELFDPDLDGDLDALLVNGHVIGNVEVFRQPIQGYEQVNLLLQNDGTGRFANVGPAAGPGLALERVSRGLAVADVDGDGDQDALVLNLFGRVDLLRNESPRDGRHWLRVRLEGTTSNRSAIGARLEAELADGRVLVRDVRSGHSYQCQSELVVHFGLGSQARVERLTVHWPSGAETVLEDLSVDRLLDVRETP